MNRKTIAIIGGGCAGSTAAWALNKVHDVVLFEADERLGGHAYTEHVPIGDDKAHIDMGVEYFSERLSPNLCELLRHFGVGTFVAPLSLRAVFDGTDNFWSNNTNAGELRRALNGEMDRFHLGMTSVLSSGDDAYKRMSIGDYLDANNYSDAFRYQAVLPLMTTFSGCNAPSLQYSLMYAALSFNMNLLSFFAPGYWRKADGGIDGYLSSITKELGCRVKPRCPVRLVRKQHNKIQVIDGDGQGYLFDTVVFATHADIALSLIDNPTSEQKDILGPFEYVDVTSVLHHDATVLSGNGQTEEYCEFSMPSTFDLRATPEEHGSLTRIGNHLFPYRNVRTPLLVTFDPKKPIRRDAIIAEKKWKLPKLRPQDSLRKTEIRRIQGVNDIWFCGQDTSLTGHEGALVSGLVIAERLGAPYPFAANPVARTQFRIIKEIMGVRASKEKLSDQVSSTAFQLAKKMGLHKTLSHRFIKDIIA